MSKELIPAYKVKQKREKIPLQYCMHCLSNRLRAACKCQQKSQKTIGASSSVQHGQTHSRNYCWNAKPLFFEAILFESDPVPLRKFDNFRSLIKNDFVFAFLLLKFLQVLQQLQELFFHLPLLRRRLLAIPSVT